MPLYLVHQCWYSFDDTTPFPGAKAILPCCVHVGLFFFFFFFEILKKCNHDLFNILCSDKIQNCDENSASLEQFLRVI